MIKFREVRIAKKVKRSDAGDVSPVAMFVDKLQILYNSKGLFGNIKLKLFKGRNVSN